MLKVAGLSALTLLLVACGSSDGSLPSDTGTDDASDTSSDTAVDVGEDADPDVDEDTAADTTPDVIEDAEPDVVEDVGEDTIADAVEDTVEDAVADTSTDTDPDVTVDVDPDTTEDTSGDVTTDVAVDTTDDTDPGVEPDNHRPDDEMCDNERAVTLPPIPFDAECLTDSDCVDGANGRCTPDRFGASCTYDECFSDSDCGGNACVCEGGRSDNNVCFPGNCATDSDCGLNGYCSPTFGGCGNYSGVVAYFCHTENDTCLNDSECVSDEFGAGYCRHFEDTNSWACAYDQCAG